MTAGEGDHGGGVADDDSTVERLQALLLGGPPTLTLADLAARAEVPVEEVERFWHTLGLPPAARDEVAYTETDAGVVARALRAGQLYEVAPRAAVSLIRAVGHTADRLVLWQVETLVGHIASRYALDEATARLLLLDRLGDAVPLMEEQMVFAWRRHLAALAGRSAADVGQARGVAAPGELPMVRAVGFADIVGFTRRTADLPASRLAEFVESFESAARDVVTSAGGRVVKTVGDAVLFVADDPVTGARVALGLAEEFGPPSATPVRVGLVWGRLLSRFGDVFGPSVNLAARLTGQGEAGTVLADTVTAQVLAGEADGAGLELTELAPREVAGLGEIRPVRVGRRRDA